MMYIICTKSNVSLSEISNLDNLIDLLNSGKVTQVSAKKLLEGNFNYSSVKDIVEYDGAMILLNENEKGECGVNFVINHCDEWLSKNPNLKFNQIYAQALSNLLQNHIKDGLDISSILDALSEYNSINMELQNSMENPSHKM